jgi:hypothetical protein
MRASPTPARRRAPRLGRVPALAVAALAAAALLVGCGSGSSAKSASSAPPHSSAATSTSTTSAAAAPGPEGIPLEPGTTLAPASSTTNGTTVDGIQCAPLEQLAYHIHAHLQVYVDGVPRALPGAIGILGPVAQQTASGPFYGASKCIYWLHTHTSDGVIHIESPTRRVYTLGDFFDEWHQPLSADQVAGASGRVTALLDGKPWTKSPRAIPLNPHATIELAVGSPVPAFETVNWSASQL